MHTGILSNETANTLAKEATAKSIIDIHLPLPLSCIKRILKDKTITEWQTIWHNVGKGRHTHNLIPIVFTTIYILSLTHQHSWRDTAPSALIYINLKRSRSSLCECGAEASWFIFTTPSTWKNNGTSGGHPHPKNWLLNTFLRTILNQKLRKTYNFLLHLS